MRLAIYSATMFSAALLTMQCPAVQAATTGAVRAYRSSRCVWSYPRRPAGGADIVARAIAHKMSEAFGQQVVVDNRIGIVGAEIVAACHR